MPAYATEIQDKLLSGGSMRGCVGAPEFEVVSATPIRVCVWACVDIAPPPCRHREPTIRVCIAPPLRRGGAPLQRPAPRVPTGRAGTRWCTINPKPDTETNLNPETETNPKPETETNPKPQTKTNPKPKTERTPHPRLKNHDSEIRDQKP